MRIRFIVIFLFVSKLILSQNFNGGLLAGLSTSQVDGDTYRGYNKAGLMFGGFVSLPLKIVEAQIEFKFIEKGSRNVPKKGIGEFYKLRLQYAELPVLVKYRVNQKICIDGGLAFGYLFASEEQLGYDGIPTRNSDTFDKIDFTVTASLYYDFLENMQFNIRYAYSILPIRPVVDLPYLRRGQHNNIICLGIYYSFLR